METGSNTATQINSIEHFDLRFSEEPAHVYILIIEFGLSYLRACWYHKSKNLITGFAQYPMQAGISDKSLQKLLEAYPFLSTEFSECICVINNAHYASLPNSTPEDRFEDIFSVTNETGEFDQFIAHDLVNLNCKIVHQSHQSETKAFEKHFSNVKFVSLLGSRIDSQLNKLKSSTLKDSIIAHIDDTHIHICAFKNGQLELCNSYFKASSEDVAYYILFVADSIDISSETVMLTLSGNISIGDDCWKLLNTYWNNLTIENLLDGIEVNPKLDQRSVGQFDYLSHHLLCAS